MSTDPHTVEARAAMDRLNQALTDAGFQFHLAGFAAVEGRTYPTFTVQMTTAQADLITEHLTPQVAAPETTTQQPGTHRVALHLVWTEIALYAEDIEIDVPDAYTGDPAALLDVDDDEFDDERWEELGVDPATMPENFKTNWLERVTFAPEEVSDRDFLDSHALGTSAGS